MKKLGLDFDNSIVNSTKAFVEVYEEIYGSIDKKWYETERYDFTDIIPDIISEIKHDVFENPFFFKVLEFYDEAKRIINEISQQTEVSIISMCAYNTVKNKGSFIVNNLPLVKFQPIIYPNFSDKSHIDMRGSIFIDDVIKNLYTCSADHTICFKYKGITQDINKDWCGDVLTKWDNETYIYLMKLLNEED